MTATQTTESAAEFDLIGYSRRNRFRIGNIHDGRPVPPARSTCKSKRIGYSGADDRLDVIVGQRGYVTTENDSLTIFVFFNSARGVTRANSTIATLAGQVTQEGDCELTASLPVAALDDALKLIRVSKLHPGNPNPPRPGEGYSV